MKFELVNNEQFLIDDKVNETVWDVGDKLMILDNLVDFTYNYIVGDGSVEIPPDFDGLQTMFASKVNSNDAKGRLLAKYGPIVVVDSIQTGSVTNMSLGLSIIISPGIGLEPTTSIRLGEIYIENSQKLTRTIEEVDEHTIYYVIAEDSFYRRSGDSMVKIGFPESYTETVSVSQNPANTYKVNPYSYTQLDISTSVVNITLNDGVNSATEWKYTIMISGENVTENSVTEINFPAGLVWEGNDVPDLNDFTTLGYDSWIIEIRNGKYASYKRYWSE